MRIASLVTAINVLVAGGFSIAGVISAKSILPVVPTEASFIFAMYAAARTIPLAFITLIAIYKNSESALLILGTLAGVIQLLDGGVGLLQHDLEKNNGASCHCRSSIFRDVSVEQVRAKQRGIATALVPSVT
jgi:hypothetical protein